jgi:hypothetical protein
MVYGYGVKQEWRTGEALEEFGGNCRHRYVQMTA